MHRRLGALAAAAAAMVVLALPAAAGAENLTSTFDAGDDGWRVTGNNPANQNVFEPPQWISSGGNPGGFIRVADATEPRLWLATSPVSWSGDRGLNYGGTIGLDVRNDNGDFPPFLALTGEEGQLTYEFSDTPTGWTTFTAPLLETDRGWTFREMGEIDETFPTKDEFISVLRELQAVWLSGDLEFGTGDVGDVDNVKLLEPATPIDTDGDGSPDGGDQCPGEVGAPSHNGCVPPPDSDGDRVPDYLDQCPAQPAQTLNGCPSAPLPTVDQACERAKQKVEAAKDKLKDADGKRAKSKARAKLKKAKEKMKEACA